MAWYSTIMNVNFVEVTETSNTIGHIRFMKSSAPGYAYAYYPASSAMFSTSGDIHLNSSYDRLGDTNGFQHPAGQHGYVSIIHEVGHAVGLKHPHSDSPNLPAAEDNFARTIMTYNFLGNSPGTMMGYDLMALHYLYGARPSRTGNDTYVALRSAVDQYRLGTTLHITPSNTTKQAIWDSGGYNTLDLSEAPSSTSGYRIDLNPLGWISTGAAYATTYFVAGLSLGPNVSVRRLVNSVSNDTIYANGEANVIAGYAITRATGNDVLHNADGDDTIDLSGYAPGEVTETTSGNDLILNFGTNGRLTVAGYYAAASNPAIVFGGLAPAASINDVTVAEGNSGTTPATFTVSLNTPATTAVSVSWATAGDTAEAGTDFVGANGTVSFAAGESEKTLTVNVIGETAIEANEQFSVALSNPTNGLTINDGTGFGSITNDDVAPNQLPVAVANGTPTSGQAPLTVAFSSAGSYDPDGSIVSYAWTFGDGGTSSAANPSRVYAAGSFTARLTVTDNRGGTATATVAITVTPAPAVPMWITAISGTAQGQGANKFARATVTVRDGNGQPVAGAVVTGQWSGLVSGSGSGTTNASGVATIDSPKSKKAGSTTFTVTTVTKAGNSYDASRNVASSVTVALQ
jgi:serralysin